MVLDGVLSHFTVRSRHMRSRDFSKEPQKSHATLLFDFALGLERELAKHKSIKPTRMRLRFYHDFALSLEADSVRAFSMACTFL